MRSRRLFLAADPIACFAALPLALVFLAGEVQGQGATLQPVQNLRCFCLPEPPAGQGGIHAEWQNADLYEEILIEVNGMPFARLPPDQESVDIPTVFLRPGPNIVVVIVRRGGMEARAGCQVQCPADPAQVPVAQVQAPRRVVVPQAGATQVVFDGRGSVDAAGGRGLLYRWQVSPDAAELVRFLEPRNAVTRVDLGLPPGIEQATLSLRLEVISLPGAGGGGGIDRTDFAVELARPTQPEPPRFLPVHPVFHRTLASFVQRTARRSLMIPLAFETGNPFPNFVLLEAPPDMRLDPATGVLIWSPVLKDIGSHRVRVGAVNPFGVDEVLFTIAVLAPEVPGLLYGFNQARNPQGGGAAVGPAPVVFAGFTHVPLPTDLYLNVPSGLDSCVVRQVVPDAAGGPDSFAALRFAPACIDGQGGGAGFSGIGGYYYTGTTADFVAALAANEFSLEVWLANVPSAQPGSPGPGDPAYIFSMTQGVFGTNWLIGTEGGGGAEQRYVTRVQTQAALVEHAVDRDFSGVAAHQLAFVRDGATHRLYVDGVEVLAAGGQSALSWDLGFEVFLGAAESGERPFTGDILLASFYAEALSPAMIAYLFDVGPTVPGIDDIDDPMATICPDPHEISRIRYDADGTESSAGYGGGGGGGGAGVPTCAEILAFLRPFEWALDPDLGTMGPLPGFADCNGKIEIVFPKPELAGVSTYDLQLTVTQIPVRGIEKPPAVATKLITLRSGNFLRGDANCDDTLDVSDPIYSLLWLFASGETPCCMDAADANDSGVVDVSDPTYLLAYLFQGGVAPPAPGAGTCGPDSTPDALECDLYTWCP
jgi:hypothetical protein